MSADKPILFSPPMVRALLNTKVNSWPPSPIDASRSCKGVTRRLSKRWLKVKAGDRLWVREKWASPEIDKTIPGRIAYDSDGLAGCWIGGGEDRHFIVHGRVLEASGYRECYPSGGSWTVGLGKYTDIKSGEYPSYKYGWRSSMFMPRWASRIELECVEDAREEKLHDISEEDAVLEGVTQQPGGGIVTGFGASFGLTHLPHLSAFANLWGALHTKPGERWEDNPSVIRIPFRRIK